MNALEQLAIIVWNTEDTKRRNRCSATVCCCWCVLKSIAHLATTYDYYDYWFDTLNTSSNNREQKNFSNEISKKERTRARNLLFHFRWFCMMISMVDRIWKETHNNENKKLTCEIQKKKIKNYSEPL